MTDTGLASGPQKIPVVIIDPIFRGSRLYYTAMIAESLLRNPVFQIEILTRVHYDATDLSSYNKIFEAVKVEPDLNVPEETWYAQITPDICGQIVDRLDKLPDGSVVIFAGFNEVMPNFVAEVATSSKNFPVSLIGYEYDPTSLSFPDKHKNFSELSRHFKSLAIWVLDERFSNIADTANNFTIKVIPDPIPYKANAPILQRARASMSAFIPDHDQRSHITLLAVGIQSVRKGLRDIIGLGYYLRDCKAPVKIFVSGKVDTSEDATEISYHLDKLSDIITTRNEYVSDEEILKTYNSCDFVLLPYSTDFNGSSGVFAHAMALGKPVISTDHGCIGWRVNYFGVGLTYSAGNIEMFRDAILNVAKWTNETYNDYSSRCKGYYLNNSFEIALSTIHNEVCKSAGDWGRSSNVNENYSCNITVDSHNNAAISSFNLQSVNSIKQICLFDTSISSKNMGDHIIMDSLKSHLRKIFPHGIFVNVPTHEYLGTESLKLIDSSDVRIVCGTNLLASHMDEYKQWKIGGIEFSLLKDLILLGCGWWQYQDEPNKYTQLLLDQILSNTSIHSVRDNYTVEKLKGLGKKTVINTTCPTMWDLTKDHLDKIPQSTARNVVTTLTDYKADPAIDSFMLNHLSKRYNKIYVWIQGSGDFQYLKRLSTQINCDLNIVPATLEAFDDLLESQIDLDYVGTRLHAGIRALQKLRRALILAVDNRANEIANDTGLPCIPRAQATKNLEHLIDSFSPRNINLPMSNINEWIRQFS